MKRKAGFTLLEIMVVVAIISILAAIAVGIVGSSRRKACVVRTTGSIQALKSACKNYANIFTDYPNLNSPPPGSPPAGPPNYNGTGGNLAYAPATNLIEFNKRLRYFMEEHAYTEGGPAWAQKRHEPLIQEPLPKMADVDGVQMYLDGFGNPLRVWWGRDHTRDTPSGPNNNNATRFRTPPDIYSIGEDSEDDIYDAPNSDTTTQINFNADGIDEIVSWRRAETR